jgi:hypothetical protein
MDKIDNFGKTIAQFEVPHSIQELMNSSREKDRRKYALEEVSKERPASAK